jgi:hypothetical protein
MRQLPGRYLLCVTSILLQGAQLHFNVTAQDDREPGHSLPEGREFGDRCLGVSIIKIFLGNCSDNATCADQNRTGNRGGLRLLGQRRHVIQRCLECGHVLIQQHNTVFVTQNNELSRYALERANLFGELPVVFGRRYTADDELLTLLSQTIQVYERPNHSNQQRQGDQPESNQDQSV